jgi:subtilisin family serine protease
LNRNTKLKVMKKKISRLLLFFTLLTLAGCMKNDNQVLVQDDIASLKSASVADKYIIVLEEDAVLALSDFNARDAGVKAKALGLLKKYEVTGEIEEVYQTALQGFTIRMAPGQAKKMEADASVKSIHADRLVSLSPIEMSGKPDGGTTQPAQSVPWGIKRVNGGVNGIGKTAWILDTGIDPTHPDLNVNTTMSATFLGGKTTAWDENGHGTHVAGIIAAKDNTIGVIGVAAGATVVSVRVLNRQGSGYYSGIIDGVDYVAEAGSSGDVANMSLGGPVYEPLDAAIQKASKVVKFVLAAGNESMDVVNTSPARTEGPNVYTISAMDRNDVFAYFSNFGETVDYCAPGVSIYSTYKGGSYRTLSGTSMAAPHVAGILLLGHVSTDGTVSNDPDGDSDPIATN